ncbi:MAG: tetratricopeptide repeat protein [Gemmatimonadota bacterium]
MRVQTSVWIPVVLAAALTAGGLEAQEPCPRRSGAEAEAGWTALRRGDLEEARRRFRGALDLCPDDDYARTGLGYVALREGRDRAAHNLFFTVVEHDPAQVDALVGLGIVAWRRGDLEAVRDRFVEVQALDPDHPTARDYLARLPEGLGPPPERPPLVLSDTLEFPARAGRDRLEVRTPEGWRPFYVRGVNLGAALPGRHPSEFPDSATYAAWIRGMAEMNANAVRVYTIHPPRFYQALLEWNRTHPDQLLWLIHGVWTELPEDHDFAAPAFEDGFFTEMQRVVDLVHGRADIPPRPGHASGFYTADVSPWTLAYIIGREWEPFSVQAFDSLQGHRSGFQGEYLEVEGGNAMDAWLGRAMEEMVAYETETYRTQRPVAYTNWPTLDPLTHPTETTVDEEMAIRRAHGERPRVRPREYDNDAIGLDASLVHATSSFPAGTFASYHAYPYYPDFMVVQEDYLRARSSLGPSNYFGYLKELKEHHEGMPVLISEYGVPASLGIAHLQPQGWHHGGLSEEEMARVDARLTREIAEAGMAGGALFAWIDEWFKKNWVVIDFENPLDRNRLWYNRMDAEQHYGVWAMEPRPAVEGQTAEERLRAWAEVEPLSESGELTLRAAADAAYLWLLVEAPGRSAGDTLFVGFDMVRPDSGDTRWPLGRGEPPAMGMEFVLVDDGTSLRLLADPPSNPFRIVEVGPAPLPPPRTVPVGDPPPGLFHQRAEMRYNLPYYTLPNDDGKYDTLRVIVNRRRFARDSTEYLAAGYDRGFLPGGEGPDGLWVRERDGTALEVRIPWTLLNVTDPSSRRVLQGPGEANARDAVVGPDGRYRLPPGAEAWPDSVFGALGTEEVSDVGIAVALGSGDAWRSWPGLRRPGGFRFAWEGWEEPAWTQRRRGVFEAMRDVYTELGGGRGEAASRPEAPGAAAPPPSPTAAQVDEADEAWKRGDTEQARILYEARLAEDPADGTALHRLGLMRAWEEDYPGALELLDRLVSLHPEDLDARVDRARVRAWGGDLDGALADLDQVLAERPDFLPALEARALFEAWAGRYEESLAAYDELLGIAPDNAQARRQQAQVLSWASRFERSRAIYDSLLSADPDDVEARLGLARVLTFADDLRGAEAEYRRVLRDHPEDVRALQGLGRTLSWGGRLVDGEQAFRRALVRDPEDLASLVGLAQNLRWQGRNAAALEVLERARALAPNNSDVREQMRWVRVALGRAVRPRVVVENDSDDNHMVSTIFVGQWHPVPRLGVRADAYQRSLSQGALERSALGLSVTASYQFEPGWTVQAGLGGSRNDGEGPRSMAAWRTGVASPGRYPAAGTLTLASYALDATALLAERGVRLREATLSGRWTPAPGWRLDGALGRAVFSGSRDNRRLNAAVSATRRLSRRWSVGAGYRMFTFEEDLTDGYFDPDFYGIGEVNGRWLYERGRWSLLVEAAPGVQKVTSAGSVAGSFRASGRVAYNVAPGREVSLSGGYSSTGLQSFSTGRSDYRYTAVILAASWVF